MARKMTFEEQAVFEEAVVRTGATSLIAEAGLFGNLESKRDAAMVLSPELGIWFDADWPSRAGS